DLRGYRRLVIADTGDQVQQPQRAFDCDGTVAVQRERRTGDGDRLNQLGTVVEGVDQFRHAGRGVQPAAHEAEGLDRVALELPLTHSMPPSSRMSSAGSARRL